ncbi:hypothetical protein E4U50_003731 [Claviceps purpurea]|nr:hypothetical protein E4U37_000888 [Claviceps purpurea]KAG6176452.1 hypothetical protein E4U27_005180 [Claviceps purpurea]KAG6217470.1 hypothetical protein E4U50_003731 [Claviceps purpurea]
MAGPSNHSMPEHWTELNALKRQKALCLAQVRALKISCKKNCGKDKVVECEECYGKVIDRLRSRFSESEEREWFTQRKAFTNELDSLLQDVKRGKRSIESIEAGIESEKEAWYRWVLRRYPEFIAISDHGVDQQEIRGMLDDPDRSRDELVQTMIEGIGKPPNWPSDVDEFADKVSAAKDSAEVKKIYITEFFIDHSTGKVLENAEKYLEDYKRSDSMTLEDVIDRIVLDIQRSRTAQPQRDAHMRRLDELRRAKTAFEQNKLQAKSLKAAQAASIKPELRDLPPCVVCGKDVPLSDVLSCTVCQALVQAGSGGQLTVYCSEDCYRKGHDSHVDIMHDCEAGDHCVQLFDDDEEMDDGVPKVVCCNECLRLKRATLYCTQDCALNNIAKHRLVRHGARDTVADGRTLISPLHEFLDTTLTGQNPGLKFSLVE